MIHSLNESLPKPPGVGEDMGKWLLGRSGTRSIPKDLLPVLQNLSLCGLCLGLTKNGLCETATPQTGYYIQTLFPFRLSRHVLKLFFSFFYSASYMIFLLEASVCCSWLCLSALSPVASRVWITLSWCISRSTSILLKIKTLR